jgi:uncharacterized protein with NAD-binding domain and iron-sulfur cluster
MSNARVAILGGGVAGLSAAHELSERGYGVAVYERRAVLGGKARSIPVPASGTGGRADLPGEHGFRFFPGFYRHITDTMRRIPVGAHGTVFDNLTVATRILLARAGRSEIVWVARHPATLDDLRVFLVELFTPLGVPPDEVAFFVSRLLVLATSCSERRLAEYECLEWWDFIGAPQRSATYQAYLGQGLTRSLVAMRAEESSVRTVGVILLQLLYGLIGPGQVFDRLLNAPTNDAWIDPWIAFLRSRGVEFHHDVRATRFELDRGRVRRVHAVQDGQPRSIEADAYISAVPVEVMASLVDEPMERAAPSLAHLGRLKTRWMSGIQFYLRRDVPLAHGHAIFLDSPWALTAISQRQFWPGVDVSRYGDGTVAGILSVDISEWEAPGILHRKPAMACSAIEIQQEVWAQLGHHLNDGLAPLIEDENLVTWFLDPAIEFPNPHTVTNLEPLLVNTAGSLQYRPEAQVEIPNLFLASDYVRTYTDIACMEAANEAARRAVNCFLAAQGSTHDPAGLWPLQEPLFLLPFQEVDRIRYRVGLPHRLASLGPEL